MATEQKENPTKIIEAVTIVVNTKPTTHDYPATEPLRAAAERALHETKNSGPLDQWVLTFNGRTLDLAKTFAEESIPSKATLHLNPRKGAGGSMEFRGSSP